MLQALDNIHITIILKLLIWIQNSHKLNVLYGK